MVSKVWDLATKSLLTTFTFPQVISCLAWDVAERFFFAAAPDGSVHQVNLFRDADEKSGIPAEAVGGAGLSDVIRIEDIPAEARRKRLISVRSELVIWPSVRPSDFFPANRSPPYVSVRLGHSSWSVLPRARYTSTTFHRTNFYGRLRRTRASRSRTWRRC